MRLKIISLVTDRFRMQSVIKAKIILGFLVLLLTPRTHAQTTASGGPGGPDSEEIYCSKIVVASVEEQEQQFLKANGIKDKSLESLKRYLKSLIIKEGFISLSNAGELKSTNPDCNCDDIKIESFKELLAIYEQIDPISCSDFLYPRKNLIPTLKTIIKAYDSK